VGKRFHTVIRKRFLERSYYPEIQLSNIIQKTEGFKMILYSQTTTMNFWSVGCPAQAMAVYPCWTFFVRSQCVFSAMSDHINIRSPCKVAPAYTYFKNIWNHSVKVLSRPYPENQRMKQRLWQLALSADRVYPSIPIANHQILWVPMPCKRPKGSL